MDGYDISKLEILLLSPAYLGIGLLIVLWVIFWLLSPFFVYGVWYRAKEIDKKMKETNRLLKVIAYGDDSNE